MLICLLRGLLCLLSLNLATSHSPQQVSIYFHRAMPIVLFIFSACFLPQKLKFPEKEALNVLFKAILSTLSTIWGTKKPLKKMCLISKWIWPPWTHTFVDCSRADQQCQMKVSASLPAPPREGCKYPFSPTTHMQQYTCSYLESLLPHLTCS